MGLEMEVVAARAHLGTNLKNEHHHTNVPVISAQGSRDIQRHIRTSTATNVQQAKSIIISLYNMTLTCRKLN